MSVDRARVLLVDLLYKEHLGDKASDMVDEALRELQPVDKQYKVCGTNPMTSTGGTMNTCTTHHKEFELLDEAFKEFIKEHGLQPSSDLYEAFTAGASAHRNLYQER